jgi:MerR family transcriptional regulator, copper efflux regulator
LSGIPAKIEVLLSACAGRAEGGCQVFSPWIRKFAQFAKPAASLSLDIDCMNSSDPLPSRYRSANGQPPSTISNPSSQVDAVHRPMRISELSKRTNLKAHTIRFYEKEGLLPARYVQRKKNNYREYAEEAVNRLLLIKEGQLAGFTIAELRELTNGDEAGPAADEKQIVLIERKLASIDRKIGRLETFKTYLTKRLALVEQKNGSG